MIYCHTRPWFEECARRLHRLYLHPLCASKPLQCSQMSLITQNCPEFTAIAVNLKNTKCFVNIGDLKCFRKPFASYSSLLSAMITIMFGRSAACIELSAGSATRVSSRARCFMDSDSLLLRDRQAWQSRSQGWGRGSEAWFEYRA